VNYLQQIHAIFKKISLDLLKKGLESPGKVLEFHLHQRVDTLKNIDMNKNYHLLIHFLNIEWLIFLQITGEKIYVSCK
jgi:hypothetical protein